MTFRDVLIRVQEIQATALERAGMGCDLDLIDVEIEEYHEEEVKRLLAELDALAKDDGEGEDETAR